MRKFFVRLVLVVLVVVFGWSSDTFAIPVSDGLVGYWAGEGNGSDASVHANHVVLQNGATFGSGKVGQAFSFDGVDDLGIGTSLGLPTGASDRTIAFWLRFPNMVVGNRMLVGWGGTAVNSMSAIMMGRGGEPPKEPFFWGNGNDLDTNSLLAEDTWHHIAFTLDGTLGKLYVNGTLDASGSLTGLDTPVGASFYLGDFPPFGFITPFGGLLDEIAVYDRALSAAEVFTLTTVPEPNTALLLGFGLLGLGVKRRRAVLH